MSGTTRKLLFAAGALVLAPVLAALLLYLFFPAERLGRLAAERASAALERDVDVSRIRLDLFPLPGVALENVTIARWRHSQAAGRDGDVGRPLAQLARVEVRPKLLPLLSRRLEVSAILVDRPVIFLEIEGKAEPSVETATEAAPGLWSDASFRIRRFEIRDGAVEYRDPRTDAVVFVHGLDQRLSLEGELRDGQLATLRLDGTIAADRIDADVPRALPMPLRNIRVAVEHRAVLDIAQQRADIQQLDVRVQELDLHGAGTVHAWADPAARTVSLRLETGAADVAGLLGSLPESWRTWPRDARGTGTELRAAGGRVAFSATVEGRLGGGELPAVDGELSLDGVAIDRGGERVLDALAGRVAFSRDSAASESLAGQLLGQPLRLSFAVHQPASPHARADLSTTIDLDRVAGLGLLPEGYAARGTMPVVLSLDGPALQPAELRVNGTVGLAGTSFGMPKLGAPVTIASGQLAFAGTDLAGRDLRATIGESDVALDFAAAQWLALAAGDSAAFPAVTFEARSRLLDLEELLVRDPARPTYTQLFLARLTERPIDGRTAEQIAEETGLRLPELPRMALDGEYRAERVLQRGGLELRDLAVQFGARNGQLEVRGADFQMLGGAVQVVAKLDPAAQANGESRAAPLALELRAQDVLAEPFLQRFTPFRGHLDGSMLLEGALNVALDQHLLPVRESLVGAGGLEVTDGALVNWPVLRALGSQLGFARFDTLAFRDWRGRFEVVGSRIVLRESAIEGGDIGARLAGSLDLSGNLELGATLLLGPRWTSLARGQAATALVAAAAGPDGRVPVGVQIRGTATQPDVSLDLSEAGARVAERARQEAEEQARDLARRLADELAERTGQAPVTPPALESPGAALDTIRNRAQDAVIGRLRGLIQPRDDRPAEPAAPQQPAGPADPAAPTDTAPPAPAQPEPAPGDTAAATP